MRYTGTKDNSLFWTAEYLIGLVDPFCNDIPSNLHTALGNVILRPFTGNFFSPAHVDFFGYEYLEGCQPTFFNQLTSRVRTYDVRINISKSRSKLRSSQPNYPNGWVLFKIFDDAFALDMALIDDDVI